MRKILALAALALGISVSAHAAEDQRVAATWKHVDVVWRITGNALTGQSAADIVAGYLDSVSIINGALADLDTSRGIDLSDMAYSAIDSNSVIRISLLGANAFASGESLYVTIDGSGDNVIFSDLGVATCATCGPGGYRATATFVPGTTRGASLGFIGAGGSVGHSPSASPLATAVAGRGPFLYGNFHGFPYIRLRLHSDYAVVPVVNTIKVRLSYLSSATGGRN